MEFTHLDKTGKASMVDVSAKQETLRTAEAYAKVILKKDVFYKVQSQQIAKGDVLSVARIAGIQAAKKTSEIIPLCHNIFISQIEIQFTMTENDFSVEINSRAKSNGPTGMEMEALVAASVAGLTIYDMCKALDKSISITNIHLVSKSGGKSGEYHE